jgi:hypothetical protein
LRDALRAFGDKRTIAGQSSIDWMIGDENKTWSAGFTLTMKTFQKGGATGDASFVVPLNPGSFSLGFKAGVTGEVTREEKIDFTEKFFKLYDFDKCPSDSATNQNNSLLQGKIGFYDLLERVALAKEHEIIKPTSLAYNLDFVIKYNGNVSPKFNLIPVGNKTLTAGLNLDGDRHNFHLLKVVFSPPVEKSCLGPKVTLKDANGKPIKDEKTGKNIEICPNYVVQVVPDAESIKKGFLPSAGVGISGELGRTSEDVDDAATQRQLELLKGRNALESLLDRERSDGLAE